MIGVLRLMLPSRRLKSLMYVYYSVIRSPDFLLVINTNFPLPSNRQHLSYGDCLEGKRGDYLTSSVLLCIIIVHILCTPI